MESAALRRPPPLPGLIQVGLIFGLLLLAAVAWALTDDRMSGMDAGPGTDPGTLGFFLGVWVVMMAAMMFPSIAPMVVMHVRIREGRAERGQATQSGTTALFIAGYLVSWTAAGLIGYAAYEIGAGSLRRHLRVGQRRPISGRGGSSSGLGSTSSPRSRTSASGSVVTR